MRPESKGALSDALRAAQDIRRYVGEIEFRDYARDDMLQAAVERKFEIAGEALNRVRRKDPDAFLLVQEYEDVIDLRNVISHRYDAIDHSLIWHSVQDELAGLIAKLEYALEQE